MTKKEIEINCRAIDDFGKGIFDYEGKTYFVDDLLPDEKAIVETTFSFGKIKETKVLKRLSDSKYRVKPLCKYYHKCGGCQLQHLNYQKQLEYKKEKVKNLIKKFASLDIVVSDCIKVDDPFYFRNKIQMPLKKERGKIVAGFYRQGTHELVKIDKCIIEDKKAEKIIKDVLSVMNEFHLDIYDEDKRKGVFRHLLLKTSSYYDECLLTFVVSDLNVKGRTNFAKKLVEKSPSIKGVIFNLNKRDTNVILGEKEEVIYGKSRIKDRIFDLDFLISSKSFYQTNFKQIENLYKTAIENSSLSKDDVVLDAYCGTGTISLSLARKVKKVIGVEIVKEAVIDARKNASLNKIENAFFINDDCTSYMERNDEKFSVVLLDPPRKGATLSFIKNVFKIKPQKVIYISCDPVTLARDLNIFKENYTVNKVIPVDMFPHSLHVETIVLLEKKPQK